MSTGLGREDIRALLDDLSAELAARGARAELFLVGGAALAVAYDAARSTRDLDAVFVPAGIVRQAAAAVAEQRGLDEALTSTTGKASRALIVCDDHKFIVASTVNRRVG